MITILLGQDYISKNEYLAEEAGQKVELRRFHAGDALPNLTTLAEPTLFGPVAAYVFDHCWKELDAEVLSKVIADSPAQVFIMEDSIDQRKTVNKEILRDKRVTVKDFEAPTKPGASKWINKHAATLGIKLNTKTSHALVEALLPDEVTPLDVGTAHNELLKLKAFAGEEAITPSMVEELVQTNQSIDLFKLLDAIGTRNKAQAHALLSKFFEISDGDDKAKAIQVSSLLADQLRNILLVQDAGARHIPDDIVLEKTGWKSGRLFIMKKLARNFTPTSVKQTMTKLESLDMELKSSTMPPHVVLDLIIAQM